jgi:probable HAF family extracellular repeat protein
MLGRLPQRSWTNNEPNSAEEVLIMFRKLMCVAAVMFAVVPMSLQLAAQEANAKHHRYKLIDLGTFGGPNSYLAYPPPGVLLSNQGSVVGLAETPDPDPFCPDCFLEGLVSYAFRWHDGVLKNLGALPGEGNSSFAFSQNARGEAVGISENGLIDPLTGYPEVVAVLWKKNHIRKLGTLGGNASYAQQVNDRGQVVGYALNTIPDTFVNDLENWNPKITSGASSNLWFPAATQSHAFLWEKGNITDLGTLGGPDSEALYINDHGQIIGESLLDSNPNPPVTAPACPTVGIPTQHPFLWRDGFIDLGSLGGTCGYPNWINNAGQVVGTMTLPGDSTNHGFSWDRGTLTDLGTLPGGTNSQAFFINDAGVVVGASEYSASSNEHAFLWKDGAMKDLGVPTECNQPEFINSKGQIVIGTGCPSVGTGIPTGIAPFLWENGVVYDLKKLVLPGSDLSFLAANSINDRGEIACAGLRANGEQHNCVLIPCDENHADVDGCDYTFVESAAAAAPALPAHDESSPATWSASRPIRGRDQLHSRLPEKCR